MYLCKITKRDVYRNSGCQDNVVNELVSCSSSVLPANAKKWIKEHFLSAYKNHVMSAFMAVKGFKALNITDSEGKPHNTYNGRATMFDEYGNPDWGYSSVGMWSEEKIDQKLEGYSN